MRRFRPRLRSEDGEVFAESVVSLVIVGAVAAAAAGVFLPASHAVSNAAQSTSRSIMLRTILSEQLPSLQNMGDGPATVTGTVNGTELPVVLWRESVDGASVLAGSVSRSFGTGVERCTGPATADDAECISARLPLPSTGIAVKELNLSPGTGPVLFNAPVPDGVTEVRYIFKATTGTPATAVFTAGSGDVTVDITPGASGYYFGRLLVNPGSTISFSTAGGAMVDTGSVMIYEAPDA